MELRRIRQFVAVAETLNFRRAAERLHMAQPPLTVSIQKLEAELGTRLFDRGPAGVALTAGGQAVLAEARKLLFHGGQLGAVARGVAEGTAGTLTVGFVGSCTAGLLQKVVRPFRASHPGVELVLREATSVAVLQQLEEHALDVGIVRTPLLRPTPATLVELERHGFVAALPRGHHLAAQATLALRDLRHEPFVMYAPTGAEGLQATAMLACQQAGFVPRVAQQAVQVQTVLALVDSGLGVALVPSVMRQDAGAGVELRALRDLPDGATTGLSLAWLPGRESPAAVRFREAAVRACR